MTYAYSVDRTDNRRLRRYDALPESMQTAWHRARPDDEALAVCSRRILLNVEDRTLATDVPGQLCRLCFPVTGETRETADLSAEERRICALSDLLSMVAEAIREQASGGQYLPSYVTSIGAQVAKLGALLTDEVAR